MLLPCRLNNLLDKASKARLLENLAKLESQGAEQIQESRHINDELMEKIRDDRKKANQREEDEEAAWKQRQEDFAAMGKKTNDSLDANLKEQDRSGRVLRAPVGDRGVGAPLPCTLLRL